MKILLSSIFLLVLVLSGCNNSAPAPKKVTNEKPTWILNPTQNGMVGSVGIAEIHIKGISYQKELAAQRARIELSQSQGVNVVSKSVFKEQYSSDARVTSSMKSNAIFTSNSTVTAHIQEVWQDKMSDRMYVWMVLDK